MSGQTIGTFVGGAVGMMFGMPQVGAMVGGAIGGYLKPEIIKGPSLGDIKMQAAQEGAFVPIPFSRPPPFFGIIVQQGPKDIRTKRERVGKGGSTKQETQEVFQSFALCCCEGPADVVRIRLFGKLAYSLYEEDQIDADTGAFASKITIYRGDETQLPSPVLEALPAEYGGGVGNVPSYRGKTMIVAESFNLTPYDGAIPQIEVEVATAAEVTPAQSSTLWIATNGAGVMQYSYGGTDWTSEPAFSVPAIGHSLVYGGGTLVCAGPTDTRYSNDFGQTWNVSTFSGGTGGQYTEFQASYVGNKFWLVPVGTSGVRAGWSVDGAHFEGKHPSVSNSFGNLSISGRRGLMVIGLNNGVGDGSVYVSTDEFDTATRVQLTGATKWTTVGTNGSRVAVGSDNGKLRYTDDGSTWSSAITIFGTQINAIKGNGSTWVAVSNSGIAYSTDNCASWTTVSLGFSLIGRDVRYHSGLWVACGQVSSGTVSKILTSPDGINWTDRAHNLPSGPGTQPVDSIVPIHCEGFEIPDSPGFYAHIDGTICGNKGARVEPGVVTLGEIERSIVRRVGIQASQFDTTQIDAIPVQGYLIGGLYSAADNLKPLQMAYFHDLPEWDLKLRAIVRGLPQKMTLVDDDFVDAPDEDSNTRRQAIEVPRKLLGFFADPGQNHVRIPVQSERESRSIPAQGTMQIEWPLVFDRDTAQQKIEITHAVMWERAQDMLVRTLPFYRFAELTPSDCVGYEGKRWLIEKTEIAEGRMRIEASRDRVLNYTSDATAPPVIGPTPPRSSIKGPTILHAMNLPSLTDDQAKPGIYLAATGLLEGWPGADIYLSTDGGVTERLVLRMLDRATMGELRAAISATDGEPLEPPIPLELYDNRTLESITTAQMDDNQNGFVLTTAGVDEIGQFQTADEPVPREWEISDAKRGEKGTTAAAHVAGARFVLLDDAIRFLPIDAEHAGKILYLRAVTIGTVPDNNETISVVYEPPEFVLYGGGDG